MPNGTYGWCERGYKLSPIDFSQSNLWSKISQKIIANSSNM